MLQSLLILCFDHESIVFWTVSQIASRLSNTGWWLIHSESVAISFPAYSKQADMEVSILSGVVHAFLGTPGSDHPYANVLGQYTTN
jgi:hypothetical protein